MTTTHTLIPDETIISKIFILRNRKVMLDRDLAQLYEVTTGNLNKAVKRNIQRFPDDFMFQLNSEEFKNLIFQTGISSWGGVRKLPYAFTEEGVAMLSGVLTSPRAIDVHIHIMRVFTKLRILLTDSTQLRIEIEQIKNSISKYGRNTELIFDYLDNLSKRVDQLEILPDQKNRKKIGFNNE